MTYPAAVTIRLQGVAKSFGETRALKSCDFEARAGEVHAIVGENGSGKSTLAKIMSGVLLADAGKVEVLGQVLTSPIEASKAGVATIFQEILVADEASIFDNLYVGRDTLFRRESTRPARESEAAALMERFVGSPVNLDAMVGTQPLHIKQWVVIARAILRRPKVLILDESSAALDLDATLRLHAEISRLRSGGSTVLIVTHRIAELVRIADRATILRDGDTAGVLEKSEITEENLLSLMTPHDRKLTTGDTIARLPRRQNGAPLLSAHGMRLKSDSAAFDFSIESGMIVGVTGLDGQGQDEFLRALAGIRLPAAGLPTLRTGGDEETIADLADAERLGIAYVSGDRKREGIFPDQSIFENLAIGIYGHKLGPAGIIRRTGIADMFQQEVARLKIKIGRPSNKITSLSGGNQQKVLIGRAFARKPRVIVLNDPARGVDLGTKRDLYLELRRFADAGGAVVYLSSEIEEFLGFADRVDVFVGHTAFRCLSGDGIAEDAILAAMFGKAQNAHVSFDKLEVRR